MKWWIGGPVMACALIAIAYVPPRGTGGFMGAIGFTTWSGRGESEAVLRRNELADQYRALDSELEAARLLVKTRPILASERAAGRPPKAIVIGADSLMDLKQQLLESALDSVWRQLDMGNTKIALVLASPSLSRNRDHPDSYSFWRSYLLPDSTDRTTCVVVFPFGGLDRERPRPGVLEQRLRYSLGPCAFYARYGAPSPRVRHWLDANDYDVAESGDWSGIRRGRDYDDDWDLANMRTFSSFMFYSYIYEMSYTKVGCLAGRVPACLDAIKRGDQTTTASFRRAVVPAARWRIRDSRLPDESVTLVAVAKEAGDDAFQQFWTTSLPIDSALTVALGRPVGEWLAERPQAKSLKITLGPVPPLSSMIGGALMGLFLLAVAAVMVQRRQVK